MSKSRKPPWLRKRIKRRIGEGTRIAGNMLLLDARNLSERPNDAAVPSGPVTRTGWINTHPRFHDPLHARRKNTKFKPWYGAHNEHKPPKPVK